MADFQPMTVFVCTSCQRADGEEVEDSLLPGVMLAARLDTLLDGDGSIRVAPVDCLAVCKRPATVAFTAIGKWTYVVGDLDADTHAEEIATAARAYAASADGIVPWKQRPPSLRRGVVARVPPPSFTQPDAPPGPAE